MATTCRRIEAYRSLKRFSFNTLKCSHCASRTTLAKLCDEGYGLSSVFSRAACPSVPLLDFREGTLQIFSCPKCTRRCKSCKPLVNDKASLNNYDLVYYLHPSYDQRNYGGYIDKNLPKVKYKKHELIKKRTNLFIRLAISPSGSHLWLPLHHHHHLRLPRLPLSLRCPLLLHPQCLCFPLPCLTNKKR